MNIQNTPKVPYVFYPHNAEFFQNGRQNAFKQDKFIDLISPEYDCVELAFFRYQIHFKYN